MENNKLQQLAYDLRNNYFAIDGGGKLEKTDEREWLQQSNFTACNENHQLFAAMYYMAFYKLGLLKSLDGFNWIKMVEFTRKPNTKGIFWRRKLDTTRTQSHDNLVGLCVGSLIFDTSHRTELRDEVYRQYFRWQVTDNEKWYQSIIQGGDVAIIDICCGRNPNFLFLSWLLLGLLVPKKDAGQINLARLRIDALQIAIKTYQFNFILKNIIKVLPWLFNKRYKDNHKSVEEYFGREGERNPYIDLMGVIYGLK